MDPQALLSLLDALPFGRELLEDPDKLLDTLMESDVATASEANERSRNLSQAHTSLLCQDRGPSDARLSMSAIAELRQLELTAHRNGKHVTALLPSGTAFLAMAWFTYQYIVSTFSAEK